MKGNVVDIAVGIIIGAAFGGIVNSLVSDVIMPPIGVLVGNVDFSNLYIILREGATAGPFASLVEAKNAGAVTISYGAFINTIINFLILAFVIFLFIRNINKLKRKEVAAPAVPTTKAGTYCFSTIPIKATRCPNCTSELKG